MSPRSTKKPTPKDQLHSSLDEFLAKHPGEETRMLEQINPTAIASSPTQEDWYQAIGED